jgi:uncharacterized membrane protein
MKSKIDVILLGILIFLLGGVAGAVSHYLYREHVKQAALKAGPQRFDVVEALAKELKLDPQQKQSLRIIIDESRKCSRELWQEYRPRWNTIRNDSDQRIKNILRDDQKALFEKFLKKISQPPQNGRTQGNAKK